jgi:hypothetical protein
VPVEPVQHLAERHFCHYRERRRATRRISTWVVLKRRDHLRRT